MEWLDEHHPEYVDRLARSGRRRSHRDRRRIVLRGDPDDDSVARSRRPDRRLHALAGEAAGREGPGRVDPRTRLGAVADRGPGGRRRPTTPCSTTFTSRTPGCAKSELYGYFLTEDDGQSAERLPGQRAAALSDSVRAAARDDRLPARHRRAASRRGRRLRRRRREIRHLARNEETRLQRRLAAAVLR